MKRKRERDIRKERNGRRRMNLDIERETRSGRVWK